jgi:CIC family chloride channel protein
MRKLLLMIPMILSCAGTAAPRTKNTDQGAIEQSVDRALNVTTLTPKKVVWMRIGHVLDNVSCRVYPVVRIAGDGSRTASIAVVVMGELSGGWSFASVTTVGFGGSAALEGPSIYGGGAIGSWLWTKLKRFHLEPRDRRIMLISGAAAGMAAVFRAPLTGLVFALEMPYKDDLAHEALLPSLIASVVSYVTLASFLGATPIFDFAGAASFTGRDLIWCALLGVVIGLIAMTFAITFRRVRGFVVKWAAPHWIKLAEGGLMTGVCGLVFVLIFRDSLVPIGPNYEAVGIILGTPHSSMELMAFGGLKLCATIFSLAFGGVSAMFVPLFLTGGALGTAFGQLVVHSPSLDLYAAVGMAAFISAGYKTPLAAVVFVAETTGGHALIIPALIGSAVAYAISGDASVSGDQRVHESVKTRV